MSRKFSRRRVRSPLQLMVHSAEPDVDSDAEPEVTRSVPRAGAVLPDWVSALLTGLALGACGWLLVTVPVVLSWVVDRTGELGPVFGTATQIWLLAHGGGLRIGEVDWTLAPLGITAALLLLVTQVSTLLARRIGGAPSSAARATPGGAPLGARTVRGPACLAGGYALVVLMTALVLGAPVQAGRAMLGALALSAVGALWGTGRVRDLGILDRLPGWARPVPAAAAAAVWAVLIGAAAALASGIVLHRERITAIVDGLGADGLNAAQLLLAQLAFWPNVLVWAASWVLGSGFTVGAGTVVSPPATNLGLLPSVPVLGALPSEGAGHWTLAWLIVGVLAGALAGLTVLSRRPAGGLSDTALSSFMAGLTALGLVILLALLSRGDLGSGRLTGLGPRVVELIVFGGALLILPAVSVGVIGGIARHWRRGRRTRWPRGAEHDPEESTRVVGGVDDREPTVDVGDRVDS